MASSSAFAALLERRALWRGEERKGENKGNAEFCPERDDIIGAPDSSLHPVSPFDILGGRLPLGHRRRVGVDLVLLALRHDGCGAWGKVPRSKNNNEKHLFDAKFFLYLPRQKISQRSVTTPHRQALVRCRWRQRRRRRRRFQATTHMPPSTSAYQGGCTCYARDSVRLQRAARTSHSFRILGKAGLAYESIHRD